MIYPIDPKIKVELDKNNLYICDFCHRANVKIILIDHVKPLNSLGVDMVETICVCEDCYKKINKEVNKALKKGR